jgi:hypothetical protein
MDKCSESNVAPDVHLLWLLDTQWQLKRNIVAARPETSTEVSLISNLELSCHAAPYLKSYVRLRNPARDSPQDAHCGATWALSEWDSMTSHAD